MNCTECQENLVACVEGLLLAEEARQCRAHLESCAACRAEYAAIEGLQQELVARGQRAAEVSLVVPVMQQIRQERRPLDWRAGMGALFTRWGFGLSAVGAAAAIMIFFGLAAPGAQAKAAQLMAKGAQAIGKLRTIHFRGQVRTLPGDNFSLVGPEFEPVPIEFWEQFGPDPRWRAEKSGRLVLMDGQSTLLYLKAPANVALKVPHPMSEAFDTDWLHRIADLSETLTEQLRQALAKNWKMSVATERGSDGRAKSVVTMQAKAPVPETDAFKNRYFDLSDTRQVYRFDSQTELLDSMQAYLVAKSGEVLVFELNQIDYNPTLDEDVFQIHLPADVTWQQSEPKTPPEKETSVPKSAKETARVFFEACARGDWAEVQRFWKLPVDDYFKQYLGGLEVITLGDASTSALFGTAQIIPYEIKLKSGVVKKHALGLKKDGNTGGWYVDGGL
ncbi:MAG TPA: hypothetical protein VJA21_26660 [Verrucomicrobiae bacterium]